MGIFRRASIIIIMTREAVSVAVFVLVSKKETPSQRTFGKQVVSITTLPSLDAYH